MAGRDKRFFAEQIDDEVTQPQAEFVAWLQADLLDCLTIDVGAVTRTKITDDQVITFDVQLTVSPADPTVVDAKRHIHSPTDISGEVFEHDLTRRCQGILAD
ncbi:hypothetical protein ETAA8_36960 [Anatilimnocola aggregata]|uniref:Uncharacterized protein n=1 Tax=Anatilimnocola aggregata TaxID=2528021 RepID=A0A517YED3_9BACT|nr:hypothetical protein ETAA8_36960 [Anatilimnocola aggregata]